MNHLAHLFLSQSDVDLMVGNYIADHVKGKAIYNYDENIQKGILMHRSIDEYTDQHPVVKKSKERLYESYHKYSPVIVDMFYDHILAKNWEEYSPIPLQLFCSNTYLLLKSRYSVFPKSAQRMYDHMSVHDWLYNYRHLEGMQKALNGLSYRARFDSKMNEAVQDLESDYELYKFEFNTFFPDLLKHSKKWQTAYE